MGSLWITQLKTQKRLYLSPYKVRRKSKKNIWCKSQRILNDERTFCYVPLQRCYIAKRIWKE